MIRDDFAGPGGWSQGLRLLNLSDEEVGVEFDKAAVDTARAAGFKRWLVDVTSDAVRNYAWGPIRLYIASPPVKVPITLPPTNKGDPLLPGSIAPRCTVTR